MTSLGAVSEVLALGNGVPLAVRRRPDAAVTTVTMWVLVGSRHEPAPGITHLAEHVLMQAVPPGRSMRVVDELESYGGEANAVTARDHLVLYARVPTPDAPAALDVLADSLTNSTFPEDLVDSERRVVDEELRLAASDPNDVVHDVFFTTAFPHHPIGRPVGGTPAAVAMLTPADLADWARATVHAGLVAVVASGDIDPDQTAALLDRGPVGALPLHTRQGQPHEDSPAATAGRGDLALNSDTAAVIFGGRGFALTDPRLPTAEVVMELLAGGNASVLHEEIRSNRGLSYDVWGVASGYRDTGVWRAGISTAPEHREEVTELGLGLLRDAVARGWSETDVRIASRRVAGLLRLEAESSLDDALLFGRYRLVGGDPTWSLESHVDALRRVSATDVQRCAQTMLDSLVVATAGGQGR